MAIPAFRLGLAASAAANNITPVDPNWANVMLLLKCDGTNGSTSFPDVSPVARPITAVGNAQVSTTSPRFGTGCLLLDGLGDRLDAANSADFDFASGAFTVELWVRPSVLGQARNIIGKRAGVGFGPWWIFMQASGIVTFRASITGSNWAVDINSTSILPTGSYTHIAVTRSGDTYRLFFNGVQEATATVSGTLFLNTSPVAIGDDTAGAAGFSGRFDEIRITKGVARYTSSFTPRSTPFPTTGP